MTTSPRLRVALLAGSMLLSVPRVPLVAQPMEPQPRESSARRRAECQRVSQAMLVGPNDSTWERSLGMFAGCDLTGAEVLANAWRRASDSSVAFDLLRATSWYRDARVLDALLEVAQDETGRRWVRHYAMHAMIRYLNPTRLLDSAPDSANEGVVTVRHFSHSMMSDGPKPLPDSAASTVARVLLGVSLRTEDARVREVARSLGGVARGDAIGGGAPDTIAQALVAALPPLGMSCTDVMFAMVWGRRSSRWELAKPRITACPQYGVAGLARGWQDGPQDTATLADRVALSKQFRDGRLHTVLDSLARDVAVRSPRRIAALEVLQSYLDPDRPPVAPWQPLPPDFRERLRATVQGLAREDADSAVSAKAREIARRQRWVW